MKTETQAVRLANMMQKRPLYPEYELALPWVQIKKSALKKLSEGDVLLLGLDSLRMILINMLTNNSTTTYLYYWPYKSYTFYTTDTVSKSQKPKCRRPHRADNRNPSNPLRGNFRL